MFPSLTLAQTWTVSWDWGDQTTSVGTVADFVASGSHAYDTPGVYTTSGTITYDDGGEGFTDYQYVVVYDPDGGFVSSGGWFYWPETGEKTNFGYTMKYNKKGQKVQGNFLLIRHVDEGVIYRVKSNALYGLALGDNADFGWASFRGKSTYLDPASPEYLEPLGHHIFIVYERIGMNQVQEPINSGLKFRTKTA